MLQRLSARKTLKRYFKSCFLFTFLLLVFFSTSYSVSAQCTKKKTRDFINQGNDFFRKNQHSKAAEVYQKAIGNEPNCPLAYFNLGQAQRLLNQFDLAIGSLERAVNLNYPDKAANYLALAAVYWSKVSTTNSRDVLTKALTNAVNAIKINDKLIDAWMIIASANRNLGDTPAELNAWEQVVRLEPNNFIAKREKALAHYRLKEYDRAITEFEQLLKLDPRNLNNYLALSDLYRLAGKNSQAMDIAARAYSLKPDSPAVMFNLGGAFLALKGYDQAIEAFKSAINLKTENLAESYYYIASAQMVQGKYNEAIENLKKSLSHPVRLYPADKFKGSVYRAFATSYGQTANFNQAIEYLLKVRQDKLDDSDLYVNLSWWYSLLGNDPKAIEAATFAVEKDPKNPMGYTNRCRANYTLERYAEAEKDCRAALAINPEDGETLFYLSRVLRDTKRKKEADETTARAIQLLEKEVGIKNTINNSSGSVYSISTGVKRNKSGSSDSSGIEEGNDLLSVNVTSPYTPYILGNAYFDQGKAFYESNQANKATASFNKAVAAYKVSLQFAPNFPLAHLNLGIIYFIQKDRKAALDEYDQLVKIDRKRAEDLKKIIEGK